MDFADVTEGVSCSKCPFSADDEVAKRLRNSGASCPKCGGYLLKVRTEIPRSPTDEEIAELKDEEQRRRQQLRKSLLTAASHLNEGAWELKAATTEFDDDADEILDLAETLESHAKDVDTDEVGDDEVLSR